MRVDDGSRPVARVWRMRGGDLDDPEFAWAYRADVLPRLQSIPGVVGLVVLLDPERKELLGISFWESVEARARSAVLVGRIIDALLRLTSAELDGPWAYDVVVSSFRRPAHVGPAPGEVEEVVVRVGGLEGGNVGDPAVVDVVAEHASGYVAQAPGCLGSLLLSDPERPVLLGASFWVDAESARRTQDLTDDVRTAMVAATRSTSSVEGRYEVLVMEPVALGWSSPSRGPTARARTRA